MVKGERKERRRVKGSSHTRTGSDDSGSSPNSSSSPLPSDEEDADTSLSSTSLDEGGAPDSEQMAQTEDLLSQSFTDLSERKQSAKREAALESIRNIMSANYLPHLLEQRVETVIQAILSSIRRSGHEQKLALDALATMAITVLDGDLVHNRPGSLGQTVLSTLSEMAFTVKGRVRASAIQTYCLWHFLGTHEHGDLLAAMMELYKNELFRPRAMVSQKTRIETTAIGVPIKTTTTPESLEIGNEVLTAALRGWGLMASALPDELRETLLTPDLRRDFNTFLTREFSVNVRMSAGENMALLYESYYQLHQGSERQAKNAEQLYYESQGLKLEEEDSITTADSQGSSKASTGSLNLKIERDTIVDLLDDVLNESSKSKSKKDRARQRSLFRDILETIEHGTSPSVEMSVHRRHVTFPSWMSILRLNYFRTVLGHGIIPHIVQNDLVRDIFQIDIDFDEKLQKLSKEHKKLLFSDTSPAKKERTVRRSKQSRGFHDALEE